MKRNMNEYLPSALNGITGIGVLSISFFIEYRFSQELAWNDKCISSVSSY